ncbi:T9SS type A sorting domain-containing protein [Flavobacterium sp. Sd200]|uniref:T9SS type A sorting domain-containing protein n=1 Tax=Flavobacterium sp. Sd200 TaxID=2692211 RepID=UPI00136B38EC|nr:T9SS type A sorting domain-containing protein [Flavobacterium sp. Sd200]MXN92762.1 T9SS type A sorting domain-containing protein [Flavobacterium sp. Sd200]
MKAGLLTIVFIAFATTGFAQSYPPAAEQPGSTAVFKDSPQITAWATGIEVQRGLINISNPDAMAAGSSYATAGLPENAIGYANGSVVSLGDGGHAIATFLRPIVNGPGFDFAVFENGSTAFLELAFVEVSSDGVNYFRFPNHSETQNQTQLGSFATPQAQYLNNLAGKYAAQYGTPFDLSDLPDNVLLDKDNITHVKIIDVVGSIDPLYASYDSFGNAVNESFPTPFASGGFDLQAVAVINQQALGLQQFGKANVCLYPNPAKGQVYLKTQADTDVLIYDVSGRLVLSAKGVYNGQAVDISALPSGTYKVEFSSNTGSSALSLVVN